MPVRFNSRLPLVHSLAPRLLGEEIDGAAGGGGRAVDAAIIERTATPKPRRGERTLCVLVMVRIVLEGAIGFSSEKIHKTLIPEHWILMMKVSRGTTEHPGVIASP